MLSPAVNILLQSIVQQFLSDSYCLTIVSEFPVDCNFNLAFTYIIPKETVEELKDQLLIASEQGCSDYIVNMRDQMMFMTAFDLVNKAGTVRRSDKKIIFAPISEEYCKNEYLDLLLMKETNYAANLVIILPNKEFQTNCEIYDLVSHKFAGSDEEIHEPMILNQWDSCTEQFKTSANLFPHDINNLLGRTVKVGTFHYKPYILLDVDPALAPTGRDGMEIRMIEEFCRFGFDACFFTFILFLCVD